MPDFPIGSGPFFDRGIDSITFKGLDVAQGMPGQHELAPAEQGQRPQLERLLSAFNLESFLDDAIRPAIEDRDVLMPHKFRRALDGALEAIRGKGRELSASDPQAAKVLERAGRVLEEEVSLRDLLQMFRSVLYQG
ncbi:MAG: hypothetical protein ABIR26_13700 [Ramlibacter sp.]